MAKFVVESVADALERSLRNSGDLRAKQAAVVASARLLAQRIDEIAGNGWIDDNGKLDNVSVPTFLRYCEKLGLTVEVDKTPKNSKQVVEEKRLPKMAAFEQAVKNV